MLAKAKDFIVRRKSFFKTIVLVLICIAVIIISVSKIRNARDTVAANNEKVSSLNEEITSLDNEIEYYEYKMTEPKEELIEEAAREKGYVYENETKYSNCTPGS